MCSMKQNFHFHSVYVSAVSTCNKKVNSDKYA